MKIIIGPSKTFFKNDKSHSSGRRPKYIKEAKEIFSVIRNLSLKETKKIYKLSDKKAEEVFKLHQDHGQKLYYAIEIYGGEVFKQLDLSNIDKEWVDNNVVILDALYGIIKPYDLIGTYRLDFKTNIGVDLKKIWKNKINKELEGEELINLASKEFSSIVKHKMVAPKLSKGPIKKARGKLLNKIISIKSIEFLEI